MKHGMNYSCRMKIINPILLEELITFNAVFIKYKKQ